MHKSKNCQIKIFVTSTFSYVFCAVMNILLNLILMYCNSTSLSSYYVTDLQREVFSLFTLSSSLDPTYEKCISDMVLTTNSETHPTKVTNQLCTTNVKYHSETKFPTLSDWQPTRHMPDGTTPYLSFIFPLLIYQT